jgi:nucleoside-diphosphate kinase
MADATERTFIMVKPDGVQRGVVGDVIHRFEQRGYKLVGLKLLQVSLKKIYIKTKTRHFNIIIGTKSFA